MAPLSAIAWFIQETTDLDGLWRFDIDQEHSIPTLYAAFLLLACAGLLAIITLAKHATQDRYTRYWAGLAIIFTYLSLDEAIELHEIMVRPLRIALNPTGLLYFPWVIVYVPLVVIFALVYLKFLLHLPPRTRNLFVLAGVIYVCGAVIVEGISANLSYLDSEMSLLYRAIVTVEEELEMLGVVVFIFALLSYFKRVQVGVDL
jgi:hypothetical protein